MAVTQRITGGDNPAWPDERRPVPRRQRRRWPWAVAAAVLVVGGWLGHSARTRHAPEVVRGLGCYSGGISGTGPTSPYAALHSFLSASLADGYPRSGYSTTSRVVVSSGVVWSATNGTTLVHRSHGQIDAIVDVDHLGSSWQVTGARRCP